MSQEADITDLAMPVVDPLEPRSQPTARRTRQPISSLEPPRKREPDSAIKFKEPLRPSQAEALFEKHADKSSKHESDLHRFLRHRGLPNPLRLLRVTGANPIYDCPAVEINAVDESEARRLAFKSWFGDKAPRESLRTRVQVVILEE